MKSFAVTMSVLLLCAESLDVAFAKPSKQNTRPQMDNLPKHKGTKLSPQVQMLGKVRGNVLFSTGTGTAFMAGFNDFTFPGMADLEGQNPIFNEAVK